MEKKGVLKDIIIQVIQFSLFYFIARNFWGTEQWYQDKVKEMSIFLGMAIMFIIIGGVLNSFGSPINMQIKQVNKRFGGNQTNFSIRGSNKTIEFERIIKVKVQLSRKYSMWGKVIAWTLKNINYKVAIEPDTSGLKLQLVDDINLHHNNSIISSTMTGIEIDVGSYIRSTLNATNQCEVFKEIEYTIIEDRSNYSTSGMFVICPKIRSTGILSKILGVFIRGNIEQHIVNFVRG